MPVFKPVSLDSVFNEPSREVQKPLEKPVKAKKARKPRKKHEKKTAPPTKPAKTKKERVKTPPTPKKTTKTRQRPTITAQFITPGGIVYERQVKEHNRFTEKKGVYDVRNVFTGDDGNRLMIISKGNPIPQPSNGATSSDAMEGQYTSATIEDLSRPMSADFSGFFDTVMSKLRMIPPGLIIGLIALVVIISNEVL